MYQSDFPVEQPTPVFDPTLIFLLILAGVAIAALAFFAGRLTGRGERREKASDAPRKIHEAIRARCAAAGSAHSGELEKKAQELLDEVERLTGPLLSFGGPCAKAFQQLSNALDGKSAGETLKAASNSGAAHDNPGKPGDDAICAVPGSEKHQGDDKRRGGGVEVLSRNVTIVGSPTVLLGARAPDAKHEGRSEHPEGPGSKEYKQVLRLAVAEFADFWNRPNSLRALEDCQKSLTTLPPMPKEKPHGADHH